MTSRTAAIEIGWLLFGLGCGWFAWIVAASMNDDWIDRHFATHAGVGPIHGWLNPDLMPAIVLSPVLAVFLVRLVGCRAVDSRVTK